MRRQQQKTPAAAQFEEWPSAAPPASLNSDALAQICRERDILLTPNRQDVLDCLLKSTAPLGAYDIIDAMRTTIGRVVAPTTVYRALDYLVAHGLVASIKSKKAFVSCVAEGAPATPMFLICDLCGISKRLEDHRVEQLFVEDAHSLGFRLGRRLVELQGTCAACATGS